MSDAFLDDLTPEQRDAASHIDGPLLILAGAGSGKTRVLTRRVGHLLAQGIPGGQICAITFTNKAAGEMRTRVEEVTGRKLPNFFGLADYSPTICTFHSLCLRILRTHGEELGFKPGFTIYDTADQTAAVKAALRTADVSSTNFTPSSVLSHISNAKNKLQTPDEFAGQANDFFQRNLAKIYKHYQRSLEESNALDFDDMLMKVALGLRDDRAVLDQLQDRFHYLMIDEYQDTNHAQYILAHMLAMRHRNIAVVGDPDQSIYAWRGADISNILSFEDDYPDAKIVKLERNYRSTQNILDAATELIKHNTGRKEKGLFTDQGAGALIDVVHCQDEYDEADQVARWLKQLHDVEPTHKWEDMAVFYRMNSLTRVLEGALRQHQIPYQIVRGTEFFGRKEIKDALAYLKVIANPDDEVSLLRILNYPTRGIGQTTINTIIAHARHLGVSVYEALHNVENIDGLNARAVTAVGKFAKLMRKWRGMLDTAPAEPVDMFTGEFHEDGGPVQRVMEAVIAESGLEKAVRKEDPEGDRAANLGELVSSAAEFDTAEEGGTLVDYLAQIALLSDVDALQADGGAVTLMTLHAAKGLEFPAVAMIGLEQDCLPHSRAAMDPEQMEEERRLAFVGITRAQRHLMLARAAVRTVRGERRPATTSQFLKEIPDHLLDVDDRTGRGGFGSFADALPRVNTTGIQVGDRVRHPKFGTGFVNDMDEVGNKATVNFQHFGEKRLLLEFA
ncbi:MAG: UvrD-helicase domain-containing protein, partial [Planctomycetota bacterium]